MLLHEGLKELKSFSAQCVKGQGVSFKRMVMDATAKKMGLEPAIFNNKLYHKLCKPKVVVSNMSTDIKIMESAVYAGMPAKNAIFLLTFMREDKVVVNYEADLHAGLSGKKLNEAVTRVLSVLLRALDGRTAKGKTNVMAKI